MFRFLCFVCLLNTSTLLGQDANYINSFLSYSFSDIHAVTKENLHLFQIKNDEQDSKIKQLCDSLKARFRDLGWREDPCGEVRWHAQFKSYEDRPLLYKVYGKGEQVSLIMSAVHPDELTPVPMGFRIARYLEKNPQIIGEKNTVVVMPLVNPDGLFRSYPTRTNANGVDCNRNFFTIDWYAKSKMMWQSGRKRSLPHFPGFIPNSEIETFFQIQMIELHAPDKILSIHAPLGFLDYDGPGDRKPKATSVVEEKARQLVHAISKKTNNYKVVDYSFYPGSLGNYAGNERSIPTVTLELQTTNPKKVDEYWEKFLPGVLQLIDYKFKGTGSTTTGNASYFFRETSRYSRKN